METTGLQLGNIVKVENLYDTAKNGTYRSVSIESLSEESAVISLMDGSSAPLDCIEGIPLTEEVLKCTNLNQAITSHCDLSYYLTDGLHLMCEDSVYYVANWNYNLGEYESHYKIKYLHQLQNQMALIGGNLIVDLDKLNNLNK